MLFILFSILLCFIIFLLLKVIYKQKLIVSDRIFHTRQIFVTLVYVVLFIIFFSPILKLINKFISIEFIHNLLMYVIPPDNVSVSFYWFVILFLAIFMSLIYLVILLITCKVWLKNVSKKNSFSEKNIFNKLSLLFYEENEGEFILKSGLENVGKWIMVMRRIFLSLLIVESIFFTIYLGLNFTFISVELLTKYIISLYMVPLLSYFLLLQIEHFLQADKKLDEVLIETREIDYVEIGNYKPLRDILRKQFLGNALISVTDLYPLANEKLYTEPSEDQLNRINSSVSKELLKSIYRSIINNVSIVNYGYIDSIIDLINNKNITVNDTCFGEFTVYMLAYLQTEFMMHRTAIIICDTDDQVNYTVELYKEQYQLMNVVNNQWVISNKDDFDDIQTQLFVCTEEDLFDLDIENRYKNFISKLSVVVFFDSYGLLCRNASFTKRIFNYFSLYFVKYIFFIPENNSKIRNVIQQQIDMKDIVLHNNERLHKKSDVFIWRREPSFYTQKALLPEGLVNDFGVAYTIAIRSAQYDVFSVNILADDSVPLKTYREIALESYGKLISENLIHDKNIDIKSIIHNNSLLSYKNQKFSIIIVYDDYNNLLNVVNIWMNYGGNNSSHLHVISRPYMLRDYFSYNISSSLAFAQKFQIIVPSAIFDDKSEILAFILKTRQGVTEEEVFDFSKTHNINKNSAVRILQHMLDCVFGDDIYSSISSYNFNETAFIYDEYGLKESVNVIKLINEEIYNLTYKLTVNNVRTTGLEKDVVLPININDVYNYYLPGQNCVVEGKSYYIQNIDDVNGILTLTNPINFNIEKEYQSLYDICYFKEVNEEPNKPINPKECLSYTVFDVQIQRIIYGYFSYSNGLDFKNPETNLTYLSVNSEYNNDISEVKVSNCFKIAFDYDFGVDYNKSAALLVVLFRGLLETLLPKNYHNILVFSEIDIESLKEPTCSDTKEKEEELEIETTHEVDDRIFNIFSGVPSLEDENSDFEGNSDKLINIYILNFSELKTGAINALSQNILNILSMLHDYLEWAISDGDNKYAYLRFGHEKLVDIFDYHTTLCMLKAFVNTDENNYKKVDLDFIDTGLGLCDFCNTPLKSAAIRLSDDRKMCQSCKNQVVDTKSEITEILDKAIRYLEEKYNLYNQIPKVKIKFKSANDIRKETTADVGSRVLGFCRKSASGVEIWIERKGPRTSMFATLVHELTHAWQFTHLQNCDKIITKYLEGHAMYVEIQSLYDIKQYTYAHRQEVITKALTDNYGTGYCYFINAMRDESDDNIFHYMIKHEEEMY